MSDLGPYSHIQRSMDWCLRTLRTIQDDEPHGFTERVDSILELAMAEERIIRSVFAGMRNRPTYNCYDGCPLHYAEGLFDVFNQVPDEVKRSFPRIWSEPEVPVVIQPGLVHNFPPKHLFPLPNRMRREKGSPTIVPGMWAFENNFHIFTNGAFTNMRHWNNVAVAGGAVLACMQPTSFDSSRWSPLQANLFFEEYYGDSDVDIFLYGLTGQEAEERMLELYEDITSALLQPAVCIRKAGNITIRAKGVRPIQIVLRLYYDISEIICGFDIDVTCCLFDGECVWANIRCLIACMRQANTVDLSRRSPSYEVRHYKYAKRAFEVYIPTLQRDKVDWTFVYNQWLNRFPPGLVRLFIFEYLEVDPLYFPNLHYPGKRIRKVRTIFGRVMDFTPVEHSSYDRVWARLPGVEFSSAEVVRHVDNMNKEMNSPWKQRKYNRRIHRHFISHGTMQECIDGINCPNCPAPITEEEKIMAQEESTRYIRGRISFIEDDPGRQLVGSFNPITNEDWEIHAYCLPAPTAATPIALVPTQHGRNRRWSWFACRRALGRLLQLVAHSLNN